MPVRVTVNKYVILFLLLSQLYLWSLISPFYFSRYIWNKTSSTSYLEVHNMNGAIYELHVFPFISIIVTFFLFALALIATQEVPSLFR